MGVRMVVRALTSKPFATRWLAAASALVVCVGQTHAATGAGCAAANRGAVDAQVAAASHVTRQLVLEAGDILTISTASSSGARAAVDLVDGAGAPLALISATSESAVRFTAAEAATYTFRFSAASAGAVSVSVTCLSTHTEAANAAFLARRKQLLNARDPDRIRIDRSATPIANADKPLSSTVAVDEEGRPKDVEFSVSLSEIAAATNGNRKPEPGIIDFWLEGRMQNYATSSFDTGTGAGNLGILYFGTRSMIGPDILVGALAQVDRGVETAEYGVADVAAQGWMAGPYMSMKLGSGVVFDGRAAWGETESAVASGVIDDSQTERRLVRGKLTGTRQVSGWSVAPSVGLVYVEDAVRDSASGATKAAGTGKVEVLPEVSRKFAVDGETFIEPRAALGAFVGFDDFTALNPAVSTVQPTDVQLKAEAGVALGVKDGSSLQATGGVESGTTTTPENWTGRLQLNVPLSK
jgi:hypothetical protein